MKLTKEMAGRLKPAGPPRALPKVMGEAPTQAHLRQRLEALRLVLESEHVAASRTAYRLESRANAANGFSHAARAAKARKVKEQRAVGARLALPLLRPFRDWSESPIVDWFAVRLVRIAPRPLDTDNLEAAFKALRDGMAQTFGVDDRDPRVRYVVDQAKGPAAVEAYLYARRSE